MMLIALIAAFVTGGAALQQWGSIHKSSGVDDCYTGPKLFFVHVMKDGGTSVHNYFQSLGLKRKFAVRIREGPTNEDRGDTSCPPAVCSAHYPFVNKTEPCGSEFSNASSFTVLREPLGRLFSLYKYYTHECKQCSSTFDNDTFASLLRGVKHGSLGTYATKLFSNDMVKNWFSPNPQWVNPHLSDVAADLLFDATVDDLEKSKQTMHQLDAVFFTEQLSTWGDDFGKSGLPLSQYARDSELPHSNERKCVDCADAPTEEEARLVNELNSLDAKLYEFAKTLPNSFWVE